MNPFNTLSDEDLMIKYMDGEYLAFEVLYLRHKDRVYSYIGKKIFKPEAIDEVFQNIFLKLHKSKEKFDPQYLFLQWLYILSRSEIVDFLRKNKAPQSVLLNENLVAETEIEKPEIFEMINNIKLTEKEKMALELKFHHDEDYETISKILKVKNTYARKIVSRGLTKLRKYFKESNNAL